MKIQNRYEYEPGKDLLGRGGFARVYRARDTLLHRDVALKVFSHSGDHRYSVLDEIRKAIGLEHPNLLRYYDVVLLEVENHLGEKEETQIGVMELANAGDLKDFARANPGSPELYRLLKEVLQGLEYLHGKGIIHRDLKAQNILLVRQDDGRLTAKISDFGISKDTGAGGQSSSMMVGTVEYMAPEQFSPAKFGIDGKVANNLDLWSFGIMVHELLTDSTPFGRRDGDTTVEQIMAQILSTELPQDIERLPRALSQCGQEVSGGQCQGADSQGERVGGLLRGFPAGPRCPFPEADTRVYPKGPPASPSATSDQDDATRAYPKGGGPGGSPQPPDADPTRVYGEKPRAESAGVRCAGQGQGCADRSNGRCGAGGGCRCLVCDRATGQAPRGGGGGEDRGGGQSVSGCEGGGQVEGGGRCQSGGGC
jgi:serine/threonine protein kinase